MSQRREGFVSPEVAADVVRTMSPSKLASWGKCEFQFFKVYVCGERRPPSAAIAFGNAMDVTADEYYAEKVKTETGWNEKSTKEHFREALGHELAEVEYWGDDTKPVMIDQGALVSALWHKQIARKVLPVETKLFFELRMSGDWFLNGEVDLIGRTEAERHLLPFASDTKTSGRKWQPKQVWDSVQPAIYSIALQNSSIEADPSRFQFHVAVRKNLKAGPAADYQVIRRPVSYAERTGVLSRLSMARRKIMAAYDSGDFLPTGRGHTLCSRRFCAFWEECEKKFGPRVPD